MSRRRPCDDAAMERHAPRTVWLLLGLVVLLPAAIYGIRAIIPSSSPSSSPRAPLSTLAAEPTPGVVDGLPEPATYLEACELEVSVCDPNDRSLPQPRAALPTALVRPLRLPRLAAGQACPRTPAALIESADLGQLGLAGSGAVGLADPGTVSAGAPWNEVGTTWLSLPTYKGPWLVRGAQLDGTGPVAFGNPPELTADLVVPPIPTMNSEGGYRTVPSGAWVQAPGCYAFQVDGLAFSKLIVVQVTLPPGE